MESDIPARKIADTSQSPCKVCGDHSYLFDVVDFNKFCDHNNYYADGLSGIPIYYRQCRNCGLIFTTDLDHLSKSEFLEFIYNEDYAKYDPDYVETRPKQNAGFLDVFLEPVKSSVRGLDYGGGNGVTAATLREKGWDFHSCDPISNPIQPSESFRDFNVISAIEVFEHIPFPISGMEDLLSYAAADCLIIIGTQVTDGQVTNNRLDWWYAAPRNGHVTLHSRASLRLLFERYGFSYQSVGTSLHLGVRGIPPDPRAPRRGCRAQLVTLKKIRRWLTRLLHK